MGHRGREERVISSKRLRIGLDATPTGIAGGERGGVYQYVLQLIRHLSSLAAESEYRLLFALTRSRHNAAIQGFLMALDRPNLTAVRCRVPSRWMRRWRIPVDLWLGRVDVFHAPAHLALTCWSGPLVVTVHDLAYLNDRAGARAPAGMPAEGSRRWEVRRRFFAELAAETEQTVRRACLVIAVSRSTREDLIAQLGVPARKIRVIYNGLRDDVAPVEDPGALENVRIRYGLSDPYGLYIGGLDPNKNLETLLEGFARYRRGGGTAMLAMAGNPGWYGPVLQAHAAKLDVAGGVRFLGYVPDRDLPVLYSGAQWVTMPSPLEGFGLPALEAMGCGTPVIVANTGALPEVVGDAGLLVDAESTEEFAQAMHALMDDTLLHASLSDAGKIRAKEFSWEQTARETLAAYAEAAKGGRELDKDV